MTLDLVIYLTISLCIILYLLTMILGSIITYFEKRIKLKNKRRMEDERD